MNLQEALNKIRKEIREQQRLVASAGTSADLYVEMNNLDDLLGAKRVLKRFLKKEVGK